MAKPDQVLTILVVDDYDDMRESIAFEFKLQGHRILEARDGNEAFDLITTNKVDTVISDIRMPNKDGIQLLDEVRKGIGPQPPIILMSGFADIPVWDAYEHGAEAFFSKPFDTKSMKEQVRKLTTPREVAWSEKPNSPDMVLEVHYKDRAHAESAEGFRVGRGGIFIGGMQGMFRKNTVVGINISIEGCSVQINGVGTVRWVRNFPEGNLPAGCGIEFNYLEPQAREKLLQCIEEKKPIAYIPRGPQTPEAVA